MPQERHGSLIPVRALAHDLDSLSSLGSAANPKPRTTSSGWVKVPCPHLEGPPGLSCSRTWTYLATEDTARPNSSCERGFEAASLSQTGLADTSVSLALSRSSGSSFPSCLPVES